MISHRTFSTITEPVVADGETPYGPMYWRDDGSVRGSVVKVFRDPGQLAAYADLHEAAHMWVQEDFEYDAWLVLGINTPLEIGEDFLIFDRRPGIYLRNLIPGLTDDLAPPTERLPLLYSVLDKLLAVSTSPRAYFIASLVNERIRTADHRAVFVEREARFYLEDLTPSPAQLEMWRSSAG